MARRWLGLALVACAQLAAGCHAPSAPEPSSTLRALATVLAAEDSRPAYRMLSRKVRAETPAAEFADHWRQSAIERHQAAAALAELSRPAAQTATLLLATGRSALLTREPEGWRVQTPRLEEPGATTPEEALQRFVQALQERSFDSVVGLLAEPLRGVVERELATRLAGLRAASSRGIQVHGGVAKIQYDSKYFIEIKNENGKWRIADFN
jgi:hypothetical protein